VIKNIKIKYILDIIKVPKSIQLNKCIHQKILMKLFYLNISEFFWKLNGSNKMKVWHSQWYQVIIVGANFLEEKLMKMCLTMNDVSCGDWSSKTLCFCQQNYSCWNNAISNLT
jgi:hypothetical protein